MASIKMQSSKMHNRGVTLIELIIAMACMMVIVLSMTYVLLPMKQYIEIDTRTLREYKQRLFAVIILQQLYIHSRGNVRVEEDTLSDGYIPYIVFYASTNQTINAMCYPHHEMFGCVFRNLISRPHISIADIQSDTGEYPGFIPLFHIGNPSATRSFVNRNLIVASTTPTTSAATIHIDQNLSSGMIYILLDGTIDQVIQFGIFPNVYLIY